MNATRSLLLSLFASTAALVPNACRAQDDNFEILGIRLGASVDAVASDVKLPGAQFFVNKGTLSMGSFTTQPMTFGEDIANGVDASPLTTSLFQVDEEYLRLAYDLRTPQKVDYIKRVRVFSKETNPSVDDLKASLIEKYGQPVNIDMNHGILLWSRKSQIRYSERDPTSWSCALSLPEMWALAKGSYGTSAALANRALPRCGSWLKVQIVRAAYNPSLVSKIQVDAGDLSEISASAAYVQHLVQSGASGAAAGEIQRRQKAPL